MLLSYTIWSVIYFLFSSNLFLYFAVSVIYFCDSLFSYSRLRTNISSTIIAKQTQPYVPGFFSTGLSLPCHNMVVYYKRAWLYNSYTMSTSSLFLQSRSRNMYKHIHHSLFFCLYKCNACKSKKTRISINVLGHPKLIPLLPTSSRSWLNTATL